MAEHALARFGVPLCAFFAREYWGYIFANL